MIYEGTIMKYPHLMQLRRVMQLSDFISQLRRRNDRFPGIFWFVKPRMCEKGNVFTSRVFFGSWLNDSLVYFDSRWSGK